VINYPEFDGGIAGAGCEGIEFLEVQFPNLVHRVWMAFQISNDLAISDVPDTDGVIVRGVVEVGRQK
jgi:hypothetical protein